MAEIEALLRHPLRINFKPYMSYDAAISLHRLKNIFEIKIDLKFSCILVFKIRNFKSSLHWTKINNKFQYLLVRV